MQTHSSITPCDVLLIHPPWFRLQDASLIHYPSGPCAIGAVLEQCGMNVTVWNTDFEPGATVMVGGTNLLDTEELTKKYTQYLANLNNMDLPVWREVKEKLLLFRPAVIGISVYSCSYQSALNVARLAKEILPQVKIVLGGVHPSIDPESCIALQEIDTVVVGEGELASKELFPVLMRQHTDEDLAAIKGIAFKNVHGDIVRTPPQPLIEDLDALPFIGRHLLHQLELHPPGAFNMLYGFRGCPYQCIFCGSFNVWGRKARTRSADSMADELEYTYRRWHTRYFYICDDMFFLKRDRAFRFFSLIRQKRLPIHLAVQARGETVTEDVLIAFKKAGGQHVSIGVEVGDDEIRKKIKKGNTVEDMRNAARLLHKTGLSMVGYFMFGFPWETEEHINRTLALLHDLQPRLAYPYIVTPSPGTALYDIARDMGLIAPDHDFSTFYHENPEMALMANIPHDERIALINRVLKTFSVYNSKSIYRDMLRHPRFYYDVARDVGLFRHPRLLWKHVVETKLSARKK